MKFDAYNGKDLQNVSALLNQFDSEGITDSRIVRQKIKEHIDKQVQKREQAQKNRPSQRPQPSAKPVKQCPECGSKNYHRGKDKFGGVTTEFMWCKSCTYSKEIK